MAFTVTRKHDRLLLPLLIGALVVVTGGLASVVLGPIWWVWVARLL